VPHLGKPPENRHHASQFFGFADGAAGPRRLATDVEKIGALGDQRFAWSTASSRFECRP
jgi:hypothetical protein